MNISEEQESKEEVSASPSAVPEAATAAVPETTTASAPNVVTPNAEETNKPNSEASENEDATATTPVANPDEPKGDPEMVPVYVKSLLPLFCRTYQSTMITSVKKSSLNLIKKMVYYLNSDLLQEVCVENSAIVGELLRFWLYYYGLIA